MLVLSFWRFRISHNVHDSGSLCDHTAHSSKQRQPPARVYFAHALTVSYGTFPSVSRQRPQSFQRLHPSRSIVLALRIFSSSHNDFTPSHLSALRIMITIRAAPIHQDEQGRSIPRISPFPCSASRVPATSTASQPPLRPRPKKQTSRTPHRQPPKH